MNGLKLFDDIPCYVSCVLGEGDQARKSNVKEILLFTTFLINEIIE